VLRWSNINFRALFRLPKSYFFPELLQETHPSGSVYEQQYSRDDLLIRNDGHKCSKKEMKAERKGTHTNLTTEICKMVKTNARNN
jgi:hypothetical protein